jgi:hypothetical protein
MVIQLAFEVALQAHDDETVNDPEPPLCATFAVFGVSVYEHVPAA